MLKFGNKEFRNLQEQVLENMKDIANLQEGTAVLDEFGIKVVGEVESIDDLPTVLEYKSEHEDWAYGDAYAVGTTSPYTLYILTRANDTIDEDHWFDIGVFPAPGPQGEQGPKGDQGIQGPTGPSGADGLDAGFGSITATAETLSAGSAATASVTVSGPNTAKELAFTFGIPQNTPAGFTHYITITASTIVGSQITGTLSLNEYNILYNNYDSVVRLRSSGSLANLYYFLKKWSVNDDYMRYVGLWSLNNVTRYFLFTVDRSNRKWTLDVGQPVKVLVSASDVDSGAATNGQVLTADGNGGASWQNAGSGSGLEVVTLTQSTSTLSDDDYNKLNGDNAIIKFVSSADGWTKYFKKYKDDGTYIYYYQVSQEDGRGTFFGGFRIVKSTKYCASLNSYLAVTSSNIKSGSTIANQYLTSNGSGGATWTSGPSFTQVQSDWNESSSSSPAYIKNKPTIPTVPVTDVTVNGTSVMDGTTAKVLVDTVDGATDGTNWTSLTINGTTAAIPSGSAPSNMVTTDTVQTITAAKYVTNNLHATTLYFEGSQNQPQIATDTTGSLLVARTNGFRIQNPTSNYNLSTPDMSLWTGNKTIATTDDIPTVPTNVSSFTNDAGYITSSALSGYATETWVGNQGYLTSVSWNDVSSKPSFATVATTGDYDDLLNKPTIPVVPTNISAFTNDSGYITGITSSNVTTALGYTPLANTACTYQTTAPTAAATDGGVHIVYLSAEPATKYSGYIYMIAEA